MGQRESRGLVIHWGPSVWDIYILDVATGQLLREISTHRISHHSLVVSRGGARLVVVSMDGEFEASEVLVWDGELRRRHTFDRNRRRFVVLPGVRRIVSINSSSAAMWDIDFGEQVFELQSDLGLLLLDPWGWEGQCLRMRPGVGGLWQGTRCRPRRTRALSPR